MTTIQIRTQEKVKKNAQAILSDLGLDMSTAINMFLVQVHKNGGIPFDILTENGMTTRAERRITEDANDARKNGKSYKDSSEMFDDILQ